MTGQSGGSHMAEEYSEDIRDAIHTALQPPAEGYEYYYYYEETDYDTNSSLYNGTDDGLSPNQFYHIYADDPEQAAVTGILWQIVLPCAALLGVVAAIVSITGLCRMPRRPGPPAHLVLLKALAVVEFIFLILFATTILPMESGLARAFTGRLLYALDIWKTWGGVLLHSSLLSSEWIVVAIGVERFLAIRRSPVGKKLRSMEKWEAIVVVVVIVSVSILVEASRFAETKFFNLKLADGTAILMLVPTHLGTNKSYVKAHRWIAEVCLLVIIPIILLTLLLFAVTYRLHQEKKEKDRVVRTARIIGRKLPSMKAVGSISADQRASALMLAVTIVDILTGAPYLICMALLSVRPDGLKLHVIHNIIGCVTFLILVKSLAHLIAYYWLSPGFWQALVCRKDKRLRSPISKYRLLGMLSRTNSEECDTTVINIPNDV